MTYLYVLFYLNLVNFGVLCYLRLVCIDNVVQM